MLDMDDREFIVCIAALIAMILIAYMLLMRTSYVEFYYDEAGREKRIVERHTL